MVINKKLKKMIIKKKGRNNPVLNEQNTHLVNSIFLLSAVDQSKLIYYFFKPK